MDAGNHQHIIPSLRETTKASDTLEHQTTVWPVRVLTRAQNISPERRASAMCVPRPRVLASRVLLSLRSRVLTCSRPTSPSPKSGSTKSRSSKSREWKWSSGFILYQELLCVVLVLVLTETAHATGISEHF